ncbi:universal stress protein [Polynucleobacter sp. CS-Odin-A6]|uniref:universal stress protein n=1 Tax=Polynucleobacter sp. CS-Odin-A6 TaxID=2689106 RepID=UPI001C0D42A6|nr:universal stress protein [Polynucleobacter sp. CS-Odin-A6]MBU3621798.1 universal stress protein [Polynucleobacter sp. CS-Odin-A6]
MKILLPIDGSKSALNAAKYVGKLAKELRSKCAVTLISVHDDIGLGHVKQFVATNVINDYLCEVSEKELKPAQKALDTAGVKHTTVIRRGNVAQEILMLANKEKFDLIVMGSKGRTGIMDAIMGSIAQKISNAAKQPVLLIK